MCMISVYVYLLGIHGNTLIRSNECIDDHYLVGSMTAWVYLYLFSFLDHPNSPKTHRGSTPWFAPFAICFFRAKGRCSSNLHILCLLCSEAIPGDSRKTLPETNSSSHPENRSFAQKKPTIVVFQTSNLQVRCFVTFREGNLL